VSLAIVIVGPLMIRGVSFDNQGRERSLRLFAASDRDKPASTILC
jgi:hypothetical protein